MVSSTGKVALKLRRLSFWAALCWLAMAGNSPTATAQTPAQVTVQFAASGYTVGQSQGKAIITVTLNQASSQPVTVNYATSDGSAIAPGDYLPATGTLIFSPGSTSQTFQVQVFQDTDANTSETVNLTLSQPVNAILGSRAAATLNIVNDNPPPAPPKVQFAFATYTVNESGGAAAILVNLLNAPANQAVTVHYATQDGTAKAPVDYVPASGTLTFAPGQTSQSFAVGLVNDGVADANKTLSLSLDSPSNASLGNQSNVCALHVSCHFASLIH